MTDIDLKQFCGNEETREYLNEPFSVGDYSYATDGRIMLRFPRRPDIPELKTENKTAKTIDWNRPLKGHDTATFEKLDLIEALPGYPDRSKKECFDCDGRGKEHDCPQCECACPSCKGQGWYEDDPEASTTIRGVPFALHYALKMVSLPGLEVGPKPTSGMPVLFRFEGGIGGLMPRRECATRHIEIEKAAAKAA